MSKLPDGALKAVFVVDILDGATGEQIDSFMDDVGARINKHTGNGMFGSRHKKIEVTTKNITELGGV